MNKPLKIYLLNKEINCFILICEIPMRRWLKSIGVNEDQMKEEWLLQCKQSGSIYFRRDTNTGIIQFSWTEESWREEYE